LKEILGVFPDAFIDWCEKYIRMNEISGGNNPVGPIMMFQTEDDEVYGDEVEDQVHGL
jgi:hypothetical protein